VGRVVIGLDDEPRAAGGIPGIAEAGPVSPANDVFDEQFEIKPTKP
jgi:hypothetical protein